MSRFAKPSQAFSIFVFFLSLLCITPGLRAQADEKVKLALSYENNADYRNAARIFQELYAQNPNSQLYFEGVVRTLRALNQFSSLIPILELRLQSKKTPELYALYGEALSKTGKASEADQAWSEGLNLDRKSPDTYAVIAEAQIQNRLFDKAIATLLKGRRELDDDNYFIEELSQLYSATGNYEKGTEEVLNLFAQTENQNLAQGKLSAFMITEEAKNFIGNTLEDRVDSESKNVHLRRLYAWFLREVDKQEKALEIYKSIDLLSNSNGRDILGFAEIARRDTDYVVALKAYELVMDRGKGNPYFMPALYGYVRTLEQRLQANPMIDASEVENIIRRYRSIIADYPQSQIAPESQLRIAYLLKNQLRDNKAAASEFQDLLEKYPNSHLTPEAAVELGNLFISLDELDKAGNTFRMVVENFSGSNAREADRAEFALAELEYFRGNFDSAQTEFANLAVKTSSDIANDALSRMILLEQAKSNPEALKNFARAELLERQGVSNKAISTFQEVTKQAPAMELAELAFLRAGMIELGEKNYQRSRELFGKLVELYPESIYSDRAIMFTGDSFAREGNKTAAIEQYTNLLVKFPKSIYLQEARDKIRRLRGDA